MRGMMLAVTVAALLLGAGCGGDGGGEGGGSTPSDERTSVVEATRAYQDTFLDGDAGATCDRLTGDAKGEVVATAAGLGGPAGCEESAERIFDLAGEDDRQRIETSRDALSADDVQVRGNTATVKLTSGRTLKLSKAGDEWLIADPGLGRR